VSCFEKAKYNARDWQGTYCKFAPARVLNQPNFSILHQKYCNEYSHLTIRKKNVS
jgi:hypothetical protein